MLHWTCCRNVASPTSLDSHYDFYIKVARELIRHLSFNKVWKDKWASAAPILFKITFKGPEHFIHWKKYRWAKRKEWQQKVTHRSLVTFGTRAWQHRWWQSTRWKWERETKEYKEQEDKERETARCRERKTRRKERQENWNSHIAQHKLIQLNK